MIEFSVMSIASRCPTVVWTEYAGVLLRMGERLGLVVTERPVGFKVEAHSNDSRLTAKTLIGWNGSSKTVDAYVVFVDLSKLSSDQFVPHLAEARKMLMQVASELLK
jgi:hypothetical protein